ncbi:vitamin K epoxide reductase family protein [Alloscardovia criceti]|uniref:vitamin K epoxide reductase family protein n=1 Tax=Alloscardovia criceti TaxID=356828 RepID=UPI00036ECCC7|nr:vitamin K epoxide reductase family protein [Alloscardovia criceti]
MVKLHGWRHASTWLYLVMLLASATALLVSFVLSAETLQLARNPQASLGCDVNAVISCSDVANSWQSEFIRFGSLSFPNAFFGIAAESVFVTVAVIGLARITMPRWFALAAWVGNLLALAYALWLFSQSVFVIQALCPWCMLLLVSTMLQFMAMSHATFAMQGIGGKSQALYYYYHLNIDLLVDLLLYAAVAAIILLKYGAALFAA